MFHKVPEGSGIFIKSQEFSAKYRKLSRQYPLILNDVSCFKEKNQEPQFFEKLGSVFIYKLGSVYEGELYDQHPAESYLGLVLVRLLKGCFNRIDLESTDESSLKKPIFYCELLWNPSVKKYKAVETVDITNGRDPRSPVKPSRYSIRGLGFKESTNDYRLMKIHYDVDVDTMSFSTRVDMYSLQSDSWSEVYSNPNRLIGFRGAIFLHGRIHWLATRNFLNDDRFGGWVPSKDSIDSILFFDLEKECFGDIRLPECDYDGANFVAFKEFEGCLGAVFYDSENKNGSVWVLDEYGVENSWHRRINIELPSSPIGFTKAGLFVCLGEEQAESTKNPGVILLDDYKFGERMEIIDYVETFPYHLPVAVAAFLYTEVLDRLLLPRMHHFLSCIFQAFNSFVCLSGEMIYCSIWRLFSCGTGKDGDPFLVEWNESEGAIKRTYNGFRKKSAGVARFDTTQNHFLAVGEDSQIKFRDMDNINLLTSTDAEGGLPSLPHLRFNKGRNLLAVTTADNGIKILANASGMRSLRTVEAPPQQQLRFLDLLLRILDSMARSIEKPRTLDNVNDKMKSWQLTEIVDPAQCRMVTMPDSTDAANKVARLLYTNSGVGNQMATANVTPQHWQPNSGLLMTNDTSGVNLEEAVPCIALSKNDSYVMTTFMPPPPPSTFLAFHPQDNNIIAIGMEDSTVHIYNVRADEVKSKLKGHQKGISGLAFSTNLNKLVSSGADAQICIWSIDTWEKRKLVAIQLPAGKAPSGETRVQFHSDQVRLLEPYQFAVGLIDGSVKVIEPTESEGKWGAENGILTGRPGSSSTANNHTPDPAQR
ncbi:hypothetical protein RD792_011330 [Penstemon davidsonii]|uniref:F-box associated beta-propeller type 1 domain-containing protein n=1 Tax=Penstemon davidsonii TaxID=160366 RepID=A0ABR0D4A2_9LAMI|nr:hypothetical protein RD792_011330 [Penstemon davidsonii]